MFKLKSLALTSIFLISAIFGLNAQDTSLKLSDTTKQVLQLPTSYNVSIIYSKRYIPNFTSIIDNFKLDGNNFYGFSLSENIHLTNTISLCSEANFQFGNMFGDFASYASLIPKIVIGGGSSFDVYFGVGPCGLGVEKNKIIGGLGIASTVGFNFNLYRGFGLNLGFQYESYSKASYNNFNFGVSYRFK
jgi:hypothetical protein